MSGILAMLPEPTPELQEATKLGISLYAGESETRFDEVLIDAFNCELKALYNYLNDLPNVDGEPPPFMPVDRVYKTLSKVTSFDAGRGCPFVCSFCSIINVHGRKSRFRGPNDVEQVIRANKAQGISRFFITDDNFARNKNWEIILDRIIELREKEGLEVRLTIQVDVQCHRIPRFINKCVAAGVKRVFIGLESINPDNLAAGLRGSQGDVRAPRVYGLGSEQVRSLECHHPPPADERRGVQANVPNGLEDLLLGRAHHY